MVNQHSSWDGPIGFFPNDMGAQPPDVGLCYFDKGPLILAACEGADTHGADGCFRFRSTTFLEFGSGRKVRALQSSIPSGVSWREAVCRLQSRAKIIALPSLRSESAIAYAAACFSPSGIGGRYFKGVAAGGANLWDSVSFCHAEKLSQIDGAGTTGMFADVA